MYCRDCKHWGTKDVWMPSVAGRYREMRHCENPNLRAASGHPASPDHEGSLTTAPDFGCIQFESKE